VVVACDSTGLPVRAAAQSAAVTMGFVVHVLGQQPAQTAEGQGCRISKIHVPAPATLPHGLSKIRLDGLQSHFPQNQRMVRVGRDL